MSNTFLKITTAAPDVCYVGPFTSAQLAHAHIAQLAQLGHAEEFELVDSVPEAEAVFTAQEDIAQCGGYAALPPVPCPVMF